VPLRPCATHVDHLDMRTVVGIRAADDVLEINGCSACSQWLRNSARRHAQVIPSIDRVVFLSSSAVASRAVAPTGRVKQKELPRSVLFSTQIRPP
jgi:hypothetical protein